VQGLFHVLHFVGRVNPRGRTRPVNAPLSRRIARAEFGLLIRNQKLFQKLADDLQVVIEVRPTNPESVRHLEAGALYKAREIKPKTIKAADVLLRGAKREDQGLVGFFLEPPEVKPGLTPRQLEIAEKRQADRATERQRYLELMKGLIARGQYAVEGIVVHGITAEGGKVPVAADYDLYDVYSAKGGRLPGGRHVELIEDMRRRDMGVMHGTVARWEDWAVRDQEEWDARAKLMAEAEKDGVIRFAPGQPMRWVKPSTPLWRGKAPWHPPVGEAGT
jgi:hypothetical protein